MGDGCLQEGVQAEAVSLAGWALSIVYHSNLQN
jgi:transketolase